MVEWLESLAICGHDVSFEVKVVEVLPDGRVKVRPIISAGGVALWQGEDDLLGQDGVLSLSGFTLRGDDLVLEGFGECI